MDGTTEIPYSKLPTRKYRGTNKNFYEDAGRERDPVVVGWCKLKHEKWTCKRSQRNDGLHHVIKKCIQHGTTENELLQILGDVKH